MALLLANFPLSGPFLTSPHLKDHDSTTPKDTSDHWGRFTPSSIMDPNSWAFHDFANQPPGYYTPTPGGANTLRHNPRAGDLHTPNLPMGLGTPLSLPTSEGALHIGQVSAATMQPIQAEGVAPHMFNNPQPFALPQPHSDFSAHAYAHSHAAFDSLEQHHGASPHEDIDFHDGSPSMAFATQPVAAGQGQTPLQKSLEQFRYRARLCASTAMVNSDEDISMTYLNKGQPYSLTIVDTGSLQMSMAPQTYRTYVRVSFDVDEFRERPTTFWQLWKEGRGTHEAHQRGGRLQAVEFVDPAQIAGSDINPRPRVDLESSSFDGFAVTWTSTPNSSSHPECSIAVRFNFLSTDFSHSKGVKGTSMRLCTKTELLHGGMGSAEPEICYCKVQLFRDHGAERKLQNDQAGTKKHIEKVQQQLAQIENGIKEFGKRKRSAPDGRIIGSGRPHKALKHRRTFSASSTSSTGNRCSVEDELRERLEGLRKKLNSSHPATMLCLRGEREDDPDLFPVQLDNSDMSGTNSDNAKWERHGSMADPTSARGSAAPALPGSAHPTTFQNPSPYMPSACLPPNEWNTLPAPVTDDLKSSVAYTSGQYSDSPQKVKRTHSMAHSDHSDWIDVMGVDNTYRPPPERVVKPDPVACFYVLYTATEDMPGDKYYRAIYLMQRTTKDLVNNIAMKRGIEPTKVLRTIRINLKGLKIVMDDESVLELPEGQDMKAEFHPVTSPTPIKRDLDLGSPEVQVDGEIPISQTQSAGYELRLRF